MPLLKGNLHTHTTLSDGRLTPLEVLRAYRDLGYDFLAFTDHRCMIGPNYFRQLPEQEGDFVILHGVEEEPDAINGRHMGVIRSPGGEELRVINHPSEYGLTVDEVVDAIRAVDAHALEITCHGRYLERYDTEAITIPKLVTDDAHHAIEIGVAWVEVDAARDADSIVRAIKEGDFHNYVSGQRLN